MRPHAYGRLTIDNAELVRRVREFLQRADLSECTWDAAAAEFGVSYRTIQHRLHTVGTSWQALKRDEKSRRLELLLDKPGKLSLTTALDELGYAEPAGLYLFFKRVKGQTYTDWRMRQQAL